MAGVHAGVEVNDGGTVTVPLAEGKIDFTKNLAGWCDADAVPGMGGSHNVGRFVHHDAGFGLPTPLGWQVEEFQFLIEFEVFNTVPR